MLPRKELPVQISDLPNTMSRVAAPVFGIAVSCTASAMGASTITTVMGTVVALVLSLACLLSKGSAPE